VSELSVPRQALGSLGSQLGQGGQAKVYLAPGVSLSDVTGPLVFKHYRSGQSPPDGLQALVGRRLRLDAIARRRLDVCTAWPVRTVEEDGGVCGVLVPLIPAEFFQERLLPSGTPGRTLLEFQHLFVDPSRARRLGMPAPNLRTRALLCRDFASALHFLHTNGLVVGDINAKNAVFRLTARPCVRLVDCDAIRVEGSAAVVAQLNAPDWDPPERRLSRATDLYKLGLLVLRTLCPGGGASLYRDPGHVRGVLDDRGHQLLVRALGDKPADRPAARDWGRYFDEEFSLRKPTRRPPEGTRTHGWMRDPQTRKWVPAQADGK
jgi:DNA-binding helix-hairpin-helix protein with protein kinase domain